MCPSRSMMGGCAEGGLWGWDWQGCSWTGGFGWRLESTWDTVSGTVHRSGARTMVCVLTLPPCVLPPSLRLWLCGPRLIYPCSSMMTR